MAELTDHQVLLHARALVAQGRIQWRPHADEQLAKRGFSRSEAKECLLRGTFMELPTIPNRKGPLQHEFAVSARVDGRRMKVAASLVPDEHLVVITVIDLDKR